MRPFVRATPGLFRAVLVLLPSLTCGCDGRGALERSGVLGLSPPASWTPAKTKDVMAPGTVLAAWNGPSGSSLCVYRTLAAPKGSARTVGMELASRVENLPGIEGLRRGTVRLGDLEAARVDLIAPGTGAAIAPSGLGVAKGPEGVPLVPTHRVSLGIPREADTLWIAWHYPEASSGQIAPEIDAEIRRISVLPARAASY